VKVDILKHLESRGLPPGRVQALLLFSLAALLPLVGGSFCVWTRMDVLGKMLTVASAALPLVPCLGCSLVGS
jgi:hypothetical protein